MKKYRQKFSKTTFVVYIVINIVGLAAIVFSALKLAGVGNLDSYFPFVDITTMAIFVFFLVFTGVLLFNAYYLFEQDKLVVRRGFEKQSVEGASITKFVYDEASGAAAVYFVDPAKQDALLYVAVIINKNEMDDFIDDLRLLKSDVIIEVNPVRPSDED